MKQEMVLLGSGRQFVFQLSLGIKEDKTGAESSFIACFLFVYIGFVH